MSEQKPEQYDVAIVGGGMVGMSLGVALAREGIKVTLIERTPLSAQLDAAFDGRVSAIALGSKHILEAIGAWEGMAAEAEPIRDIRVSDGDTPFFLHYNHDEVNEPLFGYIVENRYIRHALHAAAQKQSSLHIRDNKSITGFEYDDSGVILQLNDEAVHCRLLIGADGKYSQIRKLANIESLDADYPQTAIVCTIQHEKSHQGLAQERFLPAGPFAVLPMTGNRSSLVWVEPNDRVESYLKLSDEDFAQEIQERIGDYLGKITPLGKRFSYKLSLMHAKNYIGQRLALIGDAAHAIHPIAGQGVNLGFRDVAVLHELITNRSKLGLDIGGDEMLSHYQRWRRFDNVAMLAATDTLNRMFSTNLLPIRLARGLGLWAVGKMPPLKRVFMRHAMGLTGDVPPLAQGKKAA